MPSMRLQRVAECVIRRTRGSQGWVSYLDPHARGLVRTLLGIF